MCLVFLHYLLQDDILTYRGKVQKETEVLRIIIFFIIIKKNLNDKKSSLYVKNKKKMFKPKILERREHPAVNSFYEPEQGR